MNEEKYYNVLNRSGGTVDYVLDEIGVKRTFQAGETKRLSYTELEKLMYIPGGETLLRDYLQVTEDALQDLDIGVEPEYSMDKDDIIELLTTGSMDAFLDCLDFAPYGVIDLIQQVSVELPLNDVSKRQAIKDKTGFDVTKAIQHNEESKEENEPVATKERRVKTEEPAIPAGRRTAPQRYKRV